MDVVQEVLLIVLDFFKVVLLALPVIFVEIFRTFFPPKQKNVHGQTVLITGGGNGLGKALALEFATRGCTVIVVDIDLAAAEQTCTELKRKQVAAYAYQVDVSSYEQVEAMAIDVQKTVGPVDILVNNAGLVHFNFLEDTSTEIANRMIDINVKSHIWITGGANGLGREIAHQLAKRGCNIVIVDVDLKSAENTCAELREKGVKACCYRVDVSSFEQVKGLAATVYQDIGPVDILVNNAGLIHFTFLQDSTEQDVNRLIDVNVKSYIWTTKVFLEKMMERKQGHIVAISSMSGMYAFPWAVVYSTSKYAVNGFMAAVTEQLRLQGFSDKIQTTCVCPYYIATRKDIVEFLKKPRFKLLTTEHTACVIAKGILRNEVTVAIPPFFDLGVKIMQLFPVKVQQLVRDYIIREYELNSTQ